MSVEVGEYRLDCAIYRNRIFIESLHARMLIKNNINGTFDFASCSGLGGDSK